MLLIASHKADPATKVIVFFADDTKKTGVKPIREYECDSSKTTAFAT